MRPPIPKEKQRSVEVSTYMAQRDVTALTVLADAQGKSRSEFVRDVLLVELRRAARGVKAQAQAQA